jgi:hypothetical protein
VAEKCAFFGQKWLKNVHFFYRMAISSVPHWCWLVASMSLHFIGSLSCSATSPILPCTHVKSSVIIIEWP